MYCRDIPDFFSIRPSAVSAAYWIVDTHSANEGCVIFAFIMHYEGIASPLCHRLVDSIHHTFEDQLFTRPGADRIDELDLRKSGNHLERLTEDFATSTLRYDLRTHPSPASHKLGGMELFGDQHPIGHFKTTTMCFYCRVRLFPGRFVNDQCRKASDFFVSRIIDVDKMHVAIASRQD